MQVYRCDRCGKEIQEKALRYTVEISVQAAYDKLEVRLLDLLRDHRAELLQLVEEMKGVPADKLEDSVFKRFRFDLCPACHRAYLENPMPRKMEQDAPTGEWDVDKFLRSLGYGNREGE